MKESTVLGCLTLVMFFGGFGLVFAFAENVMWWAHVLVSLGGLSAFLSIFVFWTAVGEEMRGN